MIKSIKKIQIANLKMLGSVLLAVCLITVTSCNQKKLTKSQSSQVNSVQTDEKVYLEVEQMPKFPGGDLELRKFLANSVKYPVDAMKNKIQGKVFVGFVIGKDGSVKDAKIVRGADPLLDAEALRVVKSSPKWQPGKQKGKEVAVQYTIPINFVLQ
jgi:periplasmic protein TonB